MKILGQKRLKVCPKPGLGLFGGYFATGLLQRLKRIIKVERTGIRERKPFEEKVFYISSLTENAAEFSQRIQEHWHVENRLHWVKDVVLKEDESPLCGGYALINFGILRTREELQPIV